MEELRKSDESLYADFEDLLVLNSIELEKLNNAEQHENPFALRNIEYHSIASPNLILKLKVYFYIIYIKYLSEYLKTHNDDLESKSKLKEIKNELNKYAQNASYSD